MKHITDTLIRAIEAAGNPTVLGLDTQYAHVPPQIAERFGDSPEGKVAAIGAYNRSLMDCLCDIVPAVKVQVAYYEMLGFAGMRLFGETLAYARHKGMIAIADVKRNDIGSTASAYARAYFGEEAPFRADFVTVNPYLGADGVEPFLSPTGEHGIFALVKTSNPSGAQLQDRRMDDGHTLYETVGALVEQWGAPALGAYGYSAVGAVVGATWPEQGRRLRAQLPHTFFLVPGYGAQGGTATDLAGCFDEEGRGAIVNASRSLLTAWQKSRMPFEQAVRHAALAMRDDICGALRRRS